jgi:hypothetical protein
MDSEIKGAVRPFGISIDYDTFNTCPDTWAKVIDVLHEAGAKVVCVTVRGPDEPVHDFPGQVFYTSGEPKAEFMAKQFINYEIKIWIDDMPEHVGPPPEIKFG